MTSYIDPYRELIKQELSSVTDKGKVVFGLVTCKKLYPNYVFFQKITSWGNHELLADAISLISKNTFDGNYPYDKSKITELIESIDSVTPDMDDFSEAFASFALDACTSTINLLQFFLDDNIIHIIDIAIVSRDTVDMYINQIYRLHSKIPLDQSGIENDPLMIKEKTRKLELLGKLKEEMSNQSLEAIYLSDNDPIIEPKSLFIS